MLCMTVLQSVQGLKCVSRRCVCYPALRSAGCGEGKP